LIKKKESDKVARDRSNNGIHQERFKKRERKRNHHLSKKKSEGDASASCLRRNRVARDDKREKSRKKTKSHWEGVGTIRLDEEGNLILWD